MQWHRRARTTATGLSALERVPETQLKLAGRFVPKPIRREHLSECRRAHQAIWNIEVRMVEEIEDLHPKLQATPLGAEGHILHQ